MPSGPVLGCFEVNVSVDRQTGCYPEPWLVKFLTSVEHIGSHKKTTNSVSSKTGSSPNSKYGLVRSKVN